MNNENEKPDLSKRRFFGFGRKPEQPVPNTQTTEPNVEMVDNKITEVLDRRRLLKASAGLAVAPVIGGSPTILTNGETIATTVATAGQAGSLIKEAVKQLAPGWNSFGDVLERSGSFVRETIDIGRGYNPILDKFPAEITDNYGPQWAIRNLTRIDLKELPGTLKIDSLSPDKIAEIAQSLGGEISKDRVAESLTDLGKLLRDLQESGKKTGKVIETVAEAQKMLGERMLEVTKDFVTNCKPDLLDDLTLGDIRSALKNKYDIDVEKFDELKNAQEYVWERNRRRSEEWKKKWDTEADERRETGNENPRNREKKDQFVHCNIYSEVSDMPGKKVYILRLSRDHQTPRGFRGLNQVNFMHFLQVLMQDEPKLKELLVGETATSIFPQITKVEQGIEGGLKVSTTNTELQIVLDKLTNTTRPDGIIETGKAKDDVLIPFWTQIVKENKL